MSLNLKSHLAFPYFTQVMGLLPKLPKQAQLLQTGNTIQRVAYSVMDYYYYILVSSLATVTVVDRPSTYCS